MEGGIDANNKHVLRNNCVECCFDNEHNPPHIHVYYHEYSSTVSIPDGELLSGEIPAKKLRLVQAWIELHSDELIANWKLVTDGELPFKIEPLR